MTQQLNSNTVIVDAQFQLRESQLAVLLANQCCDLEVLFLQEAVRRIDPSAVGEDCALQSAEYSFCLAVMLRRFNRFSNRVLCPSRILDVKRSPQIFPVQGH